MIRLNAISDPMPRVPTDYMDESYKVFIVHSTLGAFEYICSACETERTVLESFKAVAGDVILEVRERHHIVQLGR
jgi:hypothetical protein